MTQNRVWSLALACLAWPTTLAGQQPAMVRDGTRDEPRVCGGGRVCGRGALARNRISFQGFVVGFSVRAWNPDTGEWDLVLLWPGLGQPRFGELHGVFRHGRGDFFTSSASPSGDTTRTRFTFADVTPKSLRWQDGTSTDGGATWGSSWIMEFTRRPVLAMGLWNGPAATTVRCPADEHRASDGHLGEWSGRRVTPRGTPLDVRVQTVRILEGCATLEHAVAVDGSRESLAVSAFEPAAQRWVRYAISTDSPTLRRWESVGANFPSIMEGTGRASRVPGRIPRLSRRLGMGGGRA